MRDFVLGLSRRSCMYRPTEEQQCASRSADEGLCFHSFLTFRLCLRCYPGGGCFCFVSTFPASTSWPNAVECPVTGEWRNPSSNDATDLKYFFEERGAGFILQKRVNRNYASEGFHDRLCVGTFVRTKVRAPLTRASLAAFFCSRSLAFQSATSWPVAACKS